MAKFATAGARAVMACAAALLLAAAARAATVTVTGTVRDGSGGGWPLYARIDATGGPTPSTAFSDPVTGSYSLTVDAGGTYTLTVQAVSGGYTPAVATLPLLRTAAGPSGGPVQDFDLLADLQSCSAPGYFGPVSNDFAAGVLPLGWSLKFTGTPWQILSGPDPCGGYDGNLTGGTGPFAVVSFCDHGISDTHLLTPTIDLAHAASAKIEWNNDYADLSSVADVDVSTDGGSSLDQRLGALRRRRARARRAERRRLGAGRRPARRPGALSLHHLLLLLVAGRQRLLRRARRHVPGPQRRARRRQRARRQHGRRHRRRFRGPASSPGRGADLRDARRPEPGRRTLPRLRRRRRSGPRGVARQVRAAGRDRDRRAARRRAAGLRARGGPALRRAAASRRAGSCPERPCSRC